MRFLPSSQEAELVNFIYLGGLEWGLGHLCVGRAVERKRKGSFLQRLQGSDWVLQLSRALHLAVLCGQLLPPSLRVRGRGDKAGAASSPDVARGPCRGRCWYAPGSPLRIVSYGCCPRRARLLPRPENGSCREMPGSAAPPPGLAGGQRLTGTGYKGLACLSQGGTTLELLTPCGFHGSGYVWASAEPTSLQVLLPSLPQWVLLKALPQ